MGYIAGLNVCRPFCVSFTLIKHLAPFFLSLSFRIKAIFNVFVFLVSLFFSSAEDVNREEAGGLYFMPLRPKHRIGEYT